MIFFNQYEINNIINQQLDYLAIYCIYFEGWVKDIKYFNGTLDKKLLLTIYQFNFTIAEH